MPDTSDATVLDDLPESIVVWEILARLPPKDALCCRAVRKSWHHATSTPDFLLAHHRHQPSLPVVKQSLDITCIDPRLVFLQDAGTGNKKPWPVLRARFNLHACRDGLLLVSNMVSRDRVFYICNPATRQCAALPQLAEHGPQQLYATSIAGLYLHHPSGEHRVLYFCRTKQQNMTADFYITTLGSDEPRRFIGRPPPSSTPSVEQALLKGLPCHDKIAPVLHRGGLHWDLGKYKHYYIDMHEIMVYDTAAETFWCLRRPAQAPLGFRTLLLEMDGMLALFSARDGVVKLFIDVFVMHDYEEEVWVLRYRIDLSAAARAELPRGELTMVFVDERELLIELPGCLLHFHIDGKVLGNLKSHDLQPIEITTHLLRESIGPLPLSETQHGTGPQFFLGL